MKAQTFLAGVLATAVGAAAALFGRSGDSDGSSARSDSPRDRAETAAATAADSVPPPSRTGSLGAAAYGDAEDRDAFADAFVVHQGLADAPRACLYNFINLYGNAIADGLVVNGARSGLGTDAPAGPKLEGESAYFQLVRIFSAFDWELGRQLRLEMGGKCIPEDVSVGSGVFPKSYVAAFQQPFSENIDKLKRALSIVAPDADALRVIQLPAAEFPFAWPGGTAYPDTYRSALLQGVRAKLAHVERATLAVGNDTSKLRAMAMAFEPLAVTMDAHFPPGNEGRAQVKVAAYLPPLRDLDIPDVDRVDSWTLATGVPKTELPRQVDISIAKLTHIGYLADRDPAKAPLIKVELSKDFAAPDKVKLRFLFGELDAGGTDLGMLPMRFDDARNALYVSFYPNLAVRETDGGVVRAFKQKFNATANLYKVDARIHQLTLTLERPASTDAAAYDQEDPPLRPKFSFKDSDISFRVHRATSDTREQGRLESVGFACDASASEDGVVDCHQDFGAYADLASFIQGDTSASPGVAGTLEGLFRKTLAYVVRVNTKLVIDWNIQTIEEAIDLQFVQMLSDLMEKQDEARGKINKRLERAVFGQ